MQSIKVVLLFLLLVQSSFGAYTYSRTVTINHLLVPNTNQADFPVLVSGTYSYLATVGNGGHVQNASGYDIGFFTNSNCSTGKMKWETEKYTAASGIVSYWVKVASLLTASDTVFYMCYGDSGITTDQSDKTNVWDADYKIVSHLADGTTLSGTDSTSNAYDGTVTAATATTGLIDGAGLFAQNGTYVSYPNNTDTQSTTFTASAWVYETGDPNSANGEAIFGKWSGGGGWMLFIGGASSGLNSINVYTGVTPFASGAILAENSWSFITVTYDTSTIKVYVNGNVPAVGSGSMFAVSALVELSRYSASANTGVTGKIDEFRFSNIVRTADWITTEYNNQSAPSSFYALGAEQGGGGGAHRTVRPIFQ